MNISLTNVRYPGQSRELLHLASSGGSELACWLALPQRIAPGARPLVAIHGIQRRAEQQASLLAERANALGRPVIAPIFPKDKWPRYQQAVVDGRADLALIDLMSSLRAARIWNTDKFDLFGFSGGAQFVHRFAMLHPTLVSRLSIASPGWYTFPDHAPYPYGLSPRPDQTDGWAFRLVTNLDRFLALPMTVFVGERDCVADKNTRSGPAIDAQQGLHRVARAQRWTQAVRAAALALDIQPDVQLHILKGCGHDFETCVTRGGLDRVVIPNASKSKLQSACKGGCSDQQRMMCQAAQNKITGSTFQPKEHTS